MNTPREIPPDAGDEFWDCEALKLAVVAPALFNRYRKDVVDRYAGIDGLKALGFALGPIGALVADVPPVIRKQNLTLKGKFGRPLKAACVRVSQCK